MNWKLAYTLTIRGLPAPQGSKKFVGTTKSGRGLMVESSKKVKPWRQDVKAEALLARGLTNGRRESGLLDPGGLNLADRAPIDAPVRMVITFTLPKPTSAPKRKRTFPMRTPDLSKLVRSTEDALTDAGIWADDARVIECNSAKVYPNEGQDALDTPGAVIRIYELLPDA
jgi:Holliday junction resolvase RusA-like endonuclease